ncbi:branched-chain amino acid aminotransferase II [Aaosphaeria arxii CBS 175.79]|uniref:Branched-chain-amino-acid aminotransferase n=1 Tax=Aaosphaeria arxii CBS 175.79 TaxID=1450172 RepID=A0A6A5XJG8_9PLEO|nr:branched-chain amino acid aminotransferase II [Aaosphaeria arxii CBS 175.79]KAF2013009.1 branched-chain amino acid aminotransferase II [Aaosphaeria arxii CBS 175.79]
MTVVTNTHTDHFLTVAWTAKDGWLAPRISPYANLSLSPTTNVLQYASSCFEGMKLYRGYDGKLRLFRPLENCRRLLDSATRVSLPAFQPEELCTLIKKLCQIEGSRWLPKDTSRGSCLYIRPTIIGTDADLGYHVPQEALLYVVITYWPSATAATPLKLLANTQQWVRAWPGGTGAAKAAANYGPGLPAHAEAKRRGFDQILWLFGPDGIVTEAGSTNIFIVWKAPAGKVELVTPSLDGGLILPGITRRSVLELARERFSRQSAWVLDGKTVETQELTVIEREITISEILNAAKEDRLMGLFAVGTAFFVNPVSQIDTVDHSINIDPNAVPHAALLRQWLSDIMYGAEESGWTQIIDEKEG